MRELQLVKWCDVCYLNNPDELAPSTQEWTIGIVRGDTGRPVPKVLDLCDEHAGPIEDLAELMGHISQIAGEAPSVNKKMRPAKDPAGPMTEHKTRPCPVCQDDIKWNVMVHHVWQWHRDDRKPPIPSTCPECGQVAESGNGMTAHRRQAHGYDALVDALSGVKGYKPPKAARKAIENGQPELVDVS